MNASPANLTRSRLLHGWLGCLLHGALAALPCLAAEPPPRILTDAEIAGLDAAHDDPWPAVAARAQAIVSNGLGGEYDGFRIGGITTLPGADRHVNIPVVAPDSAAVPQWMLPDPAHSSGPDRAVVVESDDEKWKKLLDDSEVERKWTGQDSVPVDPVHAPLAAAMLGSGNKEHVRQGLSALSVMNARKYAPQIVPLLRHGDSEVVAHAVWALNSLSAGEYLEEIASLLPASDDFVRRNVMTALASHGDERAVPPAMEFLSAEIEYDHWGFKDAALRALQKSGNAELGPDIAKLLSSKSRETCLAALDALVAVVARGQAKDIVPLLDAEFPDVIRERALHSLAALGAAESSDRIAALLQDETIVFAAVEALGRLRARQHEAAIRDVMRSGITDPRNGSSVVLRMFCSKALFLMGAVSRVETVRAIERFLSDEIDTSGMTTALRFLIELNAVESVGFILRLTGAPPRGAAQHPFFPDEQLDALKTLGFHGRCAEIARFLESPDAAERAGALVALGEFGAYEYTNEIAALIDVREPEIVRYRALRAVQRVKGTAAAQAVAALLRADQSDRILFQALEVLAGFEVRETATAVAGMTARGFSWGVRRTAFNTLLRISPQDAVGTAAALLAPDEAETVRLEVVEELARFELREAAPAVAALLEEENEQLLRAALRALRSLGGDAQVKMVTPLLRHERPGIQDDAYRTLAALGIEGRRRLLAELSSLPRPRLKAEMIDELSAWRGEGHAAKVADSLDDEEALVRLAAVVYLTGSGETGYAEALAQRLRDENAVVRAAAAEALMVFGGRQDRKTLPSILEGALRFAGHEPHMITAAYFLFGEDEIVRRALPWLGGRSPEHRPPIPPDAGAARAALEALRAVWQLADSDHHPHAIYEAATAAAEIAASVAWRPRDSAFLEELARDMRRNRELKPRAAAVQAVADKVRENDPVRRAMRWTVAVLILQPLLWALVLLVYPASRMAQWVVWQPVVRKVVGFGWVGPLVLRVPWLRERIWRPFREALVPPGEVMTFDEWTFFDALRISPAEGGKARGALEVLSEGRGVRVLRGESGLGKTTLLQALASTGRRPVVLLRAVECRDGILAALRARMPRHVRGDRNFLRTLVKRGSPDIFVDAIQELLPEAQPRLTREVESLAGGNFLLTTRPVAWIPPAGAQVWDLQPLRPTDIAPFLLKQGSAAIEAAGAGSLAERQRAFTAQAQRFLDDLAKRAPDDPEGMAMRCMLSNPMEAVLAAELLAAGQTPDPDRLLAQRMEHLGKDYSTEHGSEFPAQRFGACLLAWRRSGAPFLHLSGFEKEASFLARHRLLRKSAGDDTGWRFRHDRILEWFLQPVAQYGSGRT
jgi:HEAT repeat protein